MNPLADCLRASLVLALATSTAAGAAQSLTRVPAIGGRQAIEASECFGIAPDRSVVFLTAPDGFVAGDDNDQFDVVAHDLSTGTSSILVHALGGGSPDADAFGTRISSSGRFVVCASSASNLVAGDTNGKQDVFLLDRTSGVVARASLGTSAVQGDDASFAGDASDDGRFVAFHSNADNLVPAGASPHTQTFLRDRQASWTDLISLTPAFVPGNGPSESDPHVSDDGRFVVYISHASNLVPGDLNGWQDVFLRDRAAGTTTRLNVGPGGVESDGMVLDLHASADASRIVFEGYATTLVPGTTGGNEVYLLDRGTGQLTVVGVGPGGIGIESGGRAPRISDDGGWILLASPAALDPGATGSSPGDDAFVMDVAAGTYRCVSRSTGGLPGAPPIFTASTMSVQRVASGGSLAAFHTNRRGLVAGDTNADEVDVFLWDGLSTCAPIESFCAGKVNSWGCTPSMTSSGEPHVAGPTDAFFLATSEFMHFQVGLILWSATPAATPFSGGTLCLASPVVRTPTQLTGGTGGAACSDGTLSFHFSQAYMGLRGIVAGTTLHAQAYGRDSGAPPPFPTGLSNGIRFTTAP